MNKEEIKGEVGKEVIEDSCGCIWCDIGFTPKRGKHETARGEFPCTKEK